MFKIGEIFHGPGRLRFYALNLIQEENISVTIHADDKLQAMEPYPMTRIRRLQIGEVMDDTEKRSFMSITASLGWLGITVSLLCPYYSSYLQQSISDRRSTEQKT